MKQTERAWLERIPKVELHVHIEGAIPHDALRELIQKYGGNASCPNPASLRRKFEYRDFAHFIHTWHWKNNYLREYEDFSFIAESVARDFGRQNICYVEAFYSPGDFAHHGLQTQRITEAIREGLARVPDVTVQLVADLIRDFGPEKAAVTLAEVNEVRAYGVIGVGIGGSEHLEVLPKVFASEYLTGLYQDRPYEGDRGLREGDLLTYSQSTLSMEIATNLNRSTSAQA